MKFSSSAACLIVLLASPAILHAEIWRCPQESGTDLFTNEPLDPSKCEKYVRSTTVSPVPEPSPAPADSLGDSPTILFPYARDGPTPPDPYITPAPDYFPYSYYPFGYSPSYFGFFGFTRPRFPFSPGIQRHFGTRRHSHFPPRIQRHFGTQKHSHFGGSRHSFRRR